LSFIRFGGSFKANFGKFANGARGIAQQAAQHCL
jgi:hypothetical protein